MHDIYDGEAYKRHMEVGGLLADLMQGRRSRSGRPGGRRTNVRPSFDSFPDYNDACQSGNESRLARTIYDARTFQLL